MDRADLHLFYDTDAPEAAKEITSYGQQLQSILGDACTIVVQSDGRIDTIEGLEQMDQGNAQRLRSIRGRP